MPNITRWSPDTCDCVIDIEGDWDAPASVHSIKKCPFHTTLADGQAHFDAVWKGENQIKNFAFEIVQEHNPNVTYDDYIWSFDNNRNLVVNFPVNNMPAQAEKGLMRSACNSRFGPGKVTIN